MILLLSVMLFIRVVLRSALTCKRTLIIVVDTVHCLQIITVCILTDMHDYTISGAGSGMAGMAAAIPI